MAFPITLTGAVDHVTQGVAAQLNNVEAKIGINNSAVPTSLDYKLCNAASLDPGHRHSSLAIPAMTPANPQTGQLAYELAPGVAWLYLYDGSVWRPVTSTPE